METLVFRHEGPLGVDLDSGVTHSLETSTARLHDSQVWDALLHGEESSVWADKGYVCQSAFNRDP